MDFIIDNKNNIIYHLSNKNNLTNYSAIYAFDLDSTLITTKSCNKFPKDDNDWIILNNDIKKLLNNKDNLYVIFSNQSKIKDINNYINKLKNIINEIGDINIFISLDKNYFRKPFIGLFELFSSFYNISNYKYKYYIGDAGGRLNDFSSSDRCFANNINFTYFTPEAFFNYKYIKKIKNLKHIKNTYYDKESEDYDNNYSYGYSINKSDYSNNDYTKLNKILKNNKLKLFLIMGYPGSGKSTFCKNHLNNIYYIGLDDLKNNKNKSYKILNDKLNNKISCVIDCLNNTKNIRKKYIDIGLKYKCDIYIIHINTSKELSKYLNNYRYYKNHNNNPESASFSLGLSERTIVPDLVYNIYNKNYEEPSLEENVNEIFTYNIELFDDIFNKLF